MKKLLILLLVIVGTSISAQTTTVKPKPVNGKFKDADLVEKEWKIKSTELFGIVKAPSEKNNNDMLLLNKDSTFKLTLNNVTRSGKWSKGGVYLNFKFDDGKGKLQYKILSLENNILKVDYREEDSIHNTFEFEAK